MPRLAQRAVGTIGHLAPKAVDLLSTTGFAAAGVVSVVAENLRTLADREEALPDRAKQVAQNSVGAVLAGPKALSDRGRSLVGRDDGASGNGSRAHTAGDTSGSKTTAKTVSPDERPDRSKAEEARDREVADPSRVTADRESVDRTSGGKAQSSPTTVGGDTTEKKPPRAIDTSSADAAADTGKPASRTQDEQAGATKDAADQQKEQAKEAAAKAKDNAKDAKDDAKEAAGKGAAAARKKTEQQAEKAVKKTAEQTGKAADKAADAAETTAGKTDDTAAKAKKSADETKKKSKAKNDAKKADAKKTKAKSDAKKADAKKADAKKSDAGTSDEATADDGNGQDRPQSVEEKRAAEKAAKKQAKEKNGGSNGQTDEQEKPEGLPAGIDEQLVADLQAMTVKQLRDRAAQDGVPGRSEMSKDDLVVALATRETDGVPAKA